MSGARLQWPRHTHLVNSQSDLGRHAIINTHIFEGLHYIEVGLAAGDDAKTWIGAVHHDPVEAIDPGEFARRVDFVLVQSPLLVQGLLFCVSRPRQ